MGCEREARLRRRELYFPQRLITPLGYMITVAAGFFGKVLPARQIADGEAMAGLDSFQSSRQPDINCIGLKCVTPFTS